MRLKAANLGALKQRSDLVIPDPQLLLLPEKVLQFGTGVLLRGLPDYFIDKANRLGIFNGRIVVVKSTPSGPADEFAEQDSLYTLCVRGLLNGRRIEENIIHSCISRVLNAGADWQRILELATSKDLQLVISNTTEVGISFLAEKIGSGTPASFPGKLLAVLLQRFEGTGRDAAPGLVIVPAELITDNGTELKRILNELAVYNELGRDFTDWLNRANHFCNSLVDRIVPGKLTPAQLAATQHALGYEDELMIMAEEYRLWAIESNSPEVKSVLSFSQADEGVIICNDINRYKELKLRLLNGSHSFACGLAILTGFRTVREAMADPGFYAFIQALMTEEIIPVITSEVITETDARQFASQVLERYQNPYLDHQWEQITAQYSLKMRMRAVALVREYGIRYGQAPAAMARGFAAYFLLMIAAAKAGGNYTDPAGRFGFIIKDQLLEQFRGLPVNTAGKVEKILADNTLWQEDLNSVPGFRDAIVSAMVTLEETFFQNISKAVHE